VYLVCGAGDDIAQTRFTFALPPNTSSKLPVASCVVVQAADPEALKDKKGNPVVRPYTPTSAADNTGEIEFLIKKYETGVMSKYIHSLKVSLSGPLLWLVLTIVAWGFPQNQGPDPQVPLQGFVSVSRPYMYHLPTCFRK
jgi:hypothetical protein